MNVDRRLLGHISKPVWFPVAESMIQIIMIFKNGKLVRCFLSGRKAMKGLVIGASELIKSAFRPKTARCYQIMFRTFVAFCVYMKISLACIDAQSVLSFLECLATQKVSVHMIANYVSAIKPQLVVYCLNYSIIDDPKIKYFLKSIRINWPLALPCRNIMNLKDLKSISVMCDGLRIGFVYKAVFLVAYFGLFRLSNLSPHSQNAYDHTRHLSRRSLLSGVRLCKHVTNFMSCPCLG